jgi:hypothetical protein
VTIHELGFYKLTAPIFLAASFVIALIMEEIPVFGVSIEPWHVMLVFLAAVIVLGVDKRVIAGVGIGLIAAYPVLAAFGRNLDASRFILYAFYLILATVALMILEPGEATQ